MCLGVHGWAGWVKKMLMIKRYVQTEQQGSGYLKKGMKRKEKKKKKKKLI